MLTGVGDDFFQVHQLSSSDEEDAAPEQKELSGAIPVVDLTLEPEEAPREPDTVDAGEADAFQELEHLGTEALDALQNILQRGGTEMNDVPPEVSTVLRALGWRSEAASHFHLEVGGGDSSADNLVMPTDEAAKERHQRAVGLVGYARVVAQQAEVEREFQVKVEEAEGAAVEDEAEEAAAVAEGEGSTANGKRARASASSSDAIDLISDDENDKAASAGRRLPPAQRGGGGRGKQLMVDLLSDDDGDDAAARSAANRPAASSLPRRQMLRVRLLLPGGNGKRLNLNLPEDMELIYVLVVPRVQHALAELMAGTRRGLSALELADHFDIVGPPGGGGGGGAGARGGGASSCTRRVIFTKQSMQMTTLRTALVGGAGTLLVQLSKYAGTQKQGTGEFLFSPAASVSFGTGSCDRVVVVRLRASHDPLKAQRRGPFSALHGGRTGLGSGSFGSPVLLVKNYRQDRGVSLMREFGISAPDRGYSGGAPVQSISNVAHPDLVHHRAMGVLDLCMDLDVVKRDAQALSALTSKQSFEMDSRALAVMRAAMHSGHGYGWMAPVGLAYPRGSTLHHHVDGIGRWVVLFSFGLTCDFHVGGRTVTIESGDALVFNGSATHAVMHGLDKASSRSSLALPQGRGPSTEKPLSRLTSCLARAELSLLAGA